jgi:hypothetical protein
MRKPTAFLVSIGFFLSFYLGAQGVVTENQILDSAIRSVKLHMAGASLVLPIMDLHAGRNSLVLEFDHLGDEIQDYVYTLVHCDSDWQPSDIDDSQYLRGFREDNITMVSFSQNTRVDYTQYAVTLPNANMGWLISGNYLLRVMDLDDNRREVIVRRFMVVEPLWAIEARLVPTGKVEKMRTHHEIDFSLNTKGSRVPVPENDIKAYVLQNGRWDTSIGPLHPFGSGIGKISFDYFDRIVFPAGLEFRFFDLRSLDYRGEFVRRIDIIADSIEVTLQMDNSRAQTQVVARADINGQFVLGNNTINQSYSQSEYAKVLFSLSAPNPLEEVEVYLFGELTDWRIMPEYKLLYNEEVKAYYLETLLKQGYYNYVYAVVDRDGQFSSEYSVEGNWFETGNKYTILVYFRPFGSRYDRLLASVTLDSKPN